ncbi:hypothetical protein DNA98_04090 [Meiothermus sp. Pnk-1]|nr:hypothetical protein DNA98_04090 [Meiothermus sp. Pnk-1]
MEGVRWAEDGVPKNDPVLEETVLRAVEELSPSGREEIREIEITYQAPHRLRTQAVLTPETHKKAVERRVELARQEEQAKPVVLAGLLDEIKLDDVFHLAQLEEFPDHHRTTTARVFYPRILLPILLQLFGQRVRVVAEGVKNSTGKFEYRALSIEPLEPLEK